MPRRRRCRCAGTRPTSAVSFLSRLTAWRGPPAHLHAQHKRVALVAAGHAEVLIQVGDLQAAHRGRRRRDRYQAEQLQEGGGACLGTAQQSCSTQSGMRGTAALHTWKRCLSLHV